MIVNPVCSIKHTTVADVDATYSVPFTYITVLNVPQITVTLDGTELTYMTDYTLGSSGLKLTAEPEAGLELFIERTTPVTQEIDFQTGMIDPDEIEKSFDLSVMRDQEIQRDVDIIESKIPDEASEDNKLADKAYVDVTDQSLQSDIDTINSKIVAEASSSNKLIDKAYVDSHDQAIQSDVDTHVARVNNPHNTSIVNLIDTNINSPQIGHFLMYDGLKWINTVSSGTVGWGSILGNITDQTDLMNKFSEYVRTDGTSVMTAPLLMRATDDFKCAIAPYWDGIGFFKLNDNDSVTLMASLEYQDSFAPAENNVYNVGSTSKKWKNLYLAGKAYIPVINNGFDIAVPVTNSADTFALKSQVDDAANSGEQLYTTGVWYAKMYSASVVPTGAEYNGRTYADFSQVDSNNNPIVVIYEGQSGAWVEIARITPPANHVAYLTITSKIWDIVEQTDQQGGEVLWSYNQKTFTPYPKIVSLLNQANTNLDNLTSTGANIANWSSNVTNCIIEIPQDIKLELNNGTLTLKAGSKVYVPNGAGVFDIHNITSDQTYTQTTNGQFLLLARQDMSIWGSLTSAATSGTTPPSGSGTFYNTTTNSIDWYDNGIYHERHYSFPFALITVSNGAITSIDQVFNGFGFIGNVIYALPGVKGLMPNGRNADGTAKRYLVNTSSVVLYKETSEKENYKLLMSNLGNWISSRKDCYIDYNNELRRVTDNAVVYSYVFGEFSSDATGKIINFNTKKVFRAVDYNDVAKVGFTGSYNDLTSRPTDLFDTKWSDHLLSNSSWLRADSFSWNSGTTYSVAYQHLVADIAGKTLQSETVGGVTVQFYLADDGHKICPATEETNVSDIYTATGVAWYYVLDTGNTRFKLPRTQFGLTGYRDAVGGYVEPAAPNASLTFRSDVAGNNAASSGIISTIDQVAHFSIDGGNLGADVKEYGGSLHDGNSIYKDNATVQPPATQMYLYFYVGTFTNSALENTAGLNASLFSGKADTNLLNTDANVDFVVESQLPTAGNNYIWYRKYKSGWVEQGCLRVQDSVAFTFPVPMNDTDYSIIATTMVGTGEVKASSIRNDLKTTTDCVVYFGGSAYYGYVEVKGKAA